MNRPPDWNGAPAPSLDDFAALADAALRALPQPFRGLASEVAMRIEDFPGEDVLAELGIQDAFELTGLYQGASLGDRSVLDPSPAASQVILYRRPILDEWCERGDVALGDLIAHVLVHEIGHHFGLTDADIHAAEED